MSIGLKDYWKNNKKNSLKWKLKNLRWELRYAWRRAWYGYDDMDIIEMYASFIERYKAILKDYRENHMGLFNVPEEYKKEYNYNRDFFDEEETDAIIDTMIYHLEMMDEDNVEKALYGTSIYDDNFSVEEYVKEYSIEKMQHISSVMVHHKNEFMKLFSMFFYELWD